MLGGRAYTVVTGSVGQSFASDRKAVAIEARAASAAVQATNQMLSMVTHRHAPTSAADCLPPAPIAAVQMPAAIGVAASAFPRARVDSMAEPSYDQTNGERAEDLYQNQVENSYENA
jgi:hypothetical protein